MSLHNFCAYNFYEPTYLADVKARQALNSLWKLFDNIVIHAILLPFWLCSLQQEQYVFGYCHLPHKHIVSGIAAFKRLTLR